MLMRLAVVLGLAASLAPALGPDEIWVNRLDLGQDEMAWGIDSRGNDIVATGYFTDTSLTAGCLVVKLDQSGDTIWTRTFATGLDDYGTAVCIDAEGSVYVAGHTSQVLRAGPGPALIDATRARAGSAPALRQDQNALVLKYDADGDLKWSHVLPARGAVGVAVDDSGGCYVTGYAGDILVSSDLWWARFSSTGESLWSATLDLGLGDIGYRATRTAGPGIAFSAFVGDGDSSFGLVVRAGPAGETLWTRQVRAGANSGLLGIAADPAGNIVASGMAADSLSMSVLTAKFDSAGGLKWLDTLPASFGEGIGAACDDSGNVYVAGLANLWPDEALAVKYSPEGDTLWTVIYPGYEDEFYAVACDSAGNPVVAGRVSDGSYSDFLVIKYGRVAAVQEPRPVPAPRADAAGIVPCRAGFLLQVHVAGDYTVSALDLTGRRIAPLHSGPLAVGAHRFPTGGLPAGAYVVRVESPGRAATALRAVLVR